MYGMEACCDEVERKKEMDGIGLRPGESEVETWKQMLAIFDAVFDAFETKKYRAEQSRRPQEQAGKAQTRVIAQPSRPRPPENCWSAGLRCWQRR